VLDARPLLGKLDLLLDRYIGDEGVNAGAAAHHLALADAKLALDDRDPLLAGPR
jgi:hypothetical protein